jgi:hypothetical protein
VLVGVGLGELDVGVDPVVGVGVDDVDVVGVVDDVVGVVDDVGVSLVVGVEVYVGSVSVVGV